MKDIFIGRQAIFNRRMEIYAYELLFRTGETNKSLVRQEIDGDAASSEVLLNTFMEIGLERIAGQHLVFVNLTRKLLLSHPEIQIDRNRVVLEILEDITVDEPLMQAVETLATQGHRLALDDYTFEPEWEPILPLVEVVKVEIPALPLEEIRLGVSRLKQHNVRLLAEKIETETQYRECLEMGFDYFQGYFFSRPKLISGKRLNDNQLVILRLLSALNEPKADIQDLENIITQDASLSYKILRYINSAAVAMPSKVESISQAVILMGLKRIRAWASLMVMSGNTGTPQDHFTAALVRAYMCEKLASHRGGCAPESAFMIGLLSILDLLIGRPLEEIVKELSLPDELNAALLDLKGPAGEALRCTLAYEQQEWNSAQMEGLDDQRVISAFLYASERAFSEASALLSAEG